MTKTTANSLGEIGVEETRIPLHEEELSVDKRVVESGRVRVSRTTRSHQEEVDELLNHQEIEVEHIAFDQPIDSMPSIRQEGEVTVVPVVEEILKIERRLVLKEEVHIRRVQRTERYRDTVTLRKQEAVVSRVGSEGPLISRDRT